MAEKKIAVKWGSKVVDIPVRDDMTGCAFKQEISDLLGIPPKRQKLLGARVADSEILPVNILNGRQRLMLVGTADVATAVQAGDQKNTPESSPEERARVYLRKEIIGLANLGNTCYLNSALQMLRCIRELRGVFESTLEQQCCHDPFLAELRKIMLHQGKDSTAPTVPTRLVECFHGAYPAFAERSQEGFLLQHDSQEALTIILTHIEKALKKVSASGQSPFGDLFHISQRETLECTAHDANTEPEKKTTHSPSLMLVCHVHGDVSTIENGIESSFRPEPIEKHSDALGRNAIWQRTSLIEKLPQYIFVHIARFMWRQDTAQKAKILKNITFPMTLQASRFPQVEPTKKEYSLVSVITHKGRTGDSGHYVAWSKQEIPSLEDQSARDGTASTRASQSVWVVLDDDCSSVVSEEDIKRLSGGGESHSAYVLLYKVIE
ncbi:ubiquitin carboxyl-terminal hydrolase [Perkinsela sp. CCAP 1560/4]|nr:ubiquitin carboxyl-terminal hydrolase [Perkinsela sp. CCAP 1560/4]|eukprot:KNH09098.1 ubiquitin carboxyl-terminal hydrolase [Perkinsela sp. CCAP 1560/4]